MISPDLILADRDTVVDKVAHGHKERVPLFYYRLFPLFSLGDFFLDILGLFLQLISIASSL
jgi:hypothetical protein